MVAPAPSAHESASASRVESLPDCSRPETPARRVPIDVTGRPCWTSGGRSAERPLIRKVYSDPLRPAFERGEGRASRCCASRRAGLPEWRAPSRNVPSIRPTVARNGERSAGKAAEGFDNCADIVPLIGWQPPEVDQRVGRAALYLIKSLSAPGASLAIMIPRRRIPRRSRRSRRRRLILPYLLSPNSGSCRLR